MNKLFQKKFEISSLVIILVVLTIVVLLGNTLSLYINEPNPVVVLSGTAGYVEPGPNAPITWNLVYMDYVKGDDQFRVWSCANPEDKFYADWVVEGTFEGLLRDCMEYAHSFYP